MNRLGETIDLNNESVEKHRFTSPCFPCLALCGPYRSLSISHTACRESLREPKLRPINLLENAHVLLRKKSLLLAMVNSALWDPRLLSCASH